MHPLLALLKPDVHCKGTDYTVETVPERDDRARLRRPDRHRRRPEGSLDARPAGAHPRMNILIVRLGALGDIVHTVPAAAALRRTFPEARIDWVVDARHRAVRRARHRPIEPRRPAREGRRSRAWVAMLRRLRPAGYDVALDFQGLMKSAVLARASGARRVIGFSIFHLREKSARPFYTEVDGPEHPSHVIRKNLALLTAVGVEGDAVEFPLRARRVGRPRRDQEGAGGAAVRADQPGGGLAEQALAGGEVRRGRGVPARRPRAAARTCCGGLGSSRWRRRWWRRRMARPGSRRRPPAPDLVALSRDASLLLSGDTGPLHIAAAVGTPVVAIFGPTDPARNGPWSRRRHRHLAPRRLRLPLSAPVPPGQVVPGRPRGLRGHGGRSAPFEHDARACQPDRLSHG